MSGLTAAVVVVDDDADFRAWIAHVLLRGGIRVHECASGEEALAAAANEPPAAVIIEAELPDVDGFEICRELRAIHGDVLPIVFVSAARVTAHDRVAGLLLGADDYLVKPVNADELLARLRRILARADAAFALPRKDQRLGLSPRESEVLRLLAGGLDESQIAERLVISPKTVASHLQHVLAKLGVHSRAQAVALAYQLGFAEEAAATTEAPQ